MKYCFFVALCWLAVPYSSTAAQPLPRAHAHNDYEHSRPLLDALDHGFCSVEADIFVVDGRLLVAHDREDVTKSRTLRGLYLDPLLARVRKNGGRVHRDGPPFTLLIDFKSAAEPTYLVLREVLADYREMLVSDQADRPPAVAVIISGNRPFEMIAADRERLCGLDGRLADLDSKLSADLLPLISDNWTLHFQWRGRGDMPDLEREKLRGVVKQAHQAGRRVRFWATPESEPLWRELLDAGVDLINTDELGRLAMFLAGSEERVIPTHDSTDLSPAWSRPVKKR